MKNLVVYIIALAITSCSTTNNVVSNNKIQKRKYLKGYTISNKSQSIKTNDLVKPDLDLVEFSSETNKNFSVKQINPLNAHLENSIKSKNDDIELLASADTKNQNLIYNDFKSVNLKLPAKKTIKTFKAIKKLIDNNCAKIIFKNGDEIEAKIIEITPDLVKYKKCDNLDGPLISEKKSALLMIRYENGTKDLFNNIEELSSDNSSQSKAKTYNTNSIIFSSLSIIFTLFISISLGLILLIPAIIFAIMGAKEKLK
jgi:hypothetical protein